MCARVRVARAAGPICHGLFRTGGWPFLSSSPGHVPVSLAFFSQTSLTRAQGTDQVASPACLAGEVQTQPPLPRKDT